MSPKYVDYKHPPVVEVVFGVTFGNEVPATALLGGFWNTVRSEFPNTNDQKPLPHTIEGSPGTEERITISSLPQPRRVWMWSDDHDWLIQLQPDRFLINWKRNKSHDPYPNFDRIFDTFRKYLNQFESYIAEFTEGELEHVQYELTYVNQIDVDTGLEGVSVFDVHVDHLRSDKDARFLGRPFAFRWLDVYTLPDEWGALRVTTQHVASEDRRPVGVRVELSAKGFPSSSGAEANAGLDKWFDKAHEWVVQGFSDITNRHLQNLKWERTL